MKFVRCIAFCLVVSLLCGTALVFASCGKKGDVARRSAAKTEIDLSEYSVVYADKITSSTGLRRLFTQLADTLSARSGKTVKALTDANAKGDADAKEILIGQMNNVESQKAFNSIKGNGYAIRVIGNKIVIVGSDSMHTIYALQYFTDAFLRDGSASAKIKINKSITANRLKSVTLATETACGYRFVYSSSLWTYGYFRDPDLENVYTFCPNKDYPVIATEELVSQLAKITKLRSNKEMPIANDEEAAAEKEFLVGITNRGATEKCLAGLNGGEYGFFVEDGRFVLTAWNDSALMEGNSALADLISMATVTSGDKVTIAFPEGFHIIGTPNGDWVVDFPKPEGAGITLQNTLDTSDNSLQYLYAGEGVGPAAFRDYRDQLKAAGYALLAENEMEGSLFATLKNEEDGVLLYVAYNAFSHQNEHEYPFVYEKYLRVVASPLSENVEPPASILQPNSNYVKVTDTSVTLIPLQNEDVGMGYIITLEDGSFVVIDGGKGNARLWDALCARHREIYGSDPTAANPIHVAAWYITHSHGDHYAAANYLISAHLVDPKFKLDHIIGNYPSSSSIYPSLNDDIMSMQATVNSIKTNTTTQTTFIKAHTGQKFYFANLEMQIMMTYDDLNPQRQHNQNDTSTTIRFSLTSQDAPAAKPITMMWLGDANKQQSRWMCGMYGNYLKCDTVQIAHHGNIGCETDLYQYINAEVVFFAHNLQGFGHYMSAGSKPALVDQYAVYGNPNTKYAFIADCAHTTLTIKNGAFDFDHIYNLLTGDPIAYGEAAKIITH